MKREGHSGVRISVLLAVAIAAASAGHAAAPAVGEPSPKFKHLDANGDGYLSRDEAVKVIDADKAFTNADEDRDGRLSPEEFIKAESIQERIRTAQYFDDSVITAKVKAALLKDMQLKGFNVSVETHKGTVLLSGFVDSSEQARRAAEVAAAVDGVAAIRSNLAVKG